MKDKNQLKLFIKIKYLISDNMYKMLNKTQNVLSVEIPDGMY